MQGCNLLSMPRKCRGQSLPGFAMNLSWFPGRSLDWTGPRISLQIPLTIILHTRIWSSKFWSSISAGYSTYQACHSLLWSGIVQDWIYLLMSVQIALLQLAAALNGGAQESCLNFLLNPITSPWSSSTMYLASGIAFQSPCQTLYLLAWSNVYRTGWLVVSRRVSRSGYQSPWTCPRSHNYW